MANDEDELPLTASALVIALIALAGTIAQVLHQYYAASAAGYTNCGESVMGKWAEKTKRLFHLRELRFEVQFEAPVIFVSPPTNKNGPVPGVDIHYVDGFDESLKATRSLPAKEEEELRRENKVHTADNERATWVRLLSALHFMERDSWEWRQKHYRSTIATPEPKITATSTATSTDDPKPAGTSPSPAPTPQLRDHTLAIAVQVKQRSWDSMPAVVKKPYATTTICHMLEIAAMLGIYWKEFDRSKDRYRAEGNGYLLTGTQITDLGLMFTFQVSGGSRFHENRVIPVDEVKELCCGMVSTFFRADKDTRRLGALNEDPRDLGILHLGSMNELAETMVLIDCNTITASYFRRNDTKHGHLFPLPFELLGMLCKNLHIAGTPFRMLPNPTPYHWDKKFFNLRKLVREFHKKLKSQTVQKAYTHPAFKQFEQHADKVAKALEENKAKNQQLREADQNRVKQEIKDKQASIAGPPPPPPTVAAATGNKAQPDGQARWRRGFRIPTFPSLPSKLVGAKRPPRDEENPTPDGESKPAYHRQTSSFGALGAMATKQPTSAYSMELLDTLDEAIAECDNFLKEMVKRQPALVRTVLREHFQEVLKMLNNGDDDDDTQPPTPSAKTKVRIDESAAKSRRPRKFEELSLASPEDRQKIFMDIYFTDVLSEVKTRAAASFTKMSFYNKKTRPESPFRPPTSPNLLSPPIDLAAGDPSDAESDVGDQGDTKARQTWQQEAAAIWCVFVFRMLCWLTLHDFDKNDVQVSKSELMGSRLPVYIS